MIDERLSRAGSDDRRLRSISSATAQGDGTGWCRRHGTVPEYSLSSSVGTAAASAITLSSVPRIATLTLAGSTGLAFLSVDWVTLQITVTSLSVMTPPSLGSSEDSGLVTSTTGAPAGCSSPPVPPVFIEPPLPPEPPLAAGATLTSRATSSPTQTGAGFVLAAGGHTERYEKPQRKISIHEPSPLVHRPRVTGPRQTNKISVRFRTIRQTGFWARF